MRFVQMNEERFEKWNDNSCKVKDNQEDTLLDWEDVVDKLNEQQFIIEELKTHNLQHFLEWLVIKGYVTDEPMKDINNVIDCVNKFKEYLSVLNKLTEINNEIGFDSDE